MKITLESKILLIKKVLKNTSAKGWRDIKAGDCISLSLDINDNHGSAGAYQVYILVNVNGKNNFYSSMSKSYFYLDMFAIEELK